MDKDMARAANPRRASNHAHTKSKKKKTIAPSKCKLPLISTITNGLSAYNKTRSFGNCKRLKIKGNKYKLPNSQSSKKVRNTKTLP